VSIVAEVAAAVGLAEGEAGVRDVLRAVARREPVAVRKVSRATELPVPIVSAICNELRKRGAVDRRRPVQLTPLGRELAGTHVHVDPTCTTCEGRGHVVPPELRAVVHELTALAARAPRARLELDQSHCTVETKVRRVLALLEADALAGKQVLLLGDDDLTSIAIRLVADELGVAIGRVVVLDVDPAVVAYVRRPRFRIEAAVHDLREPLPRDLRGAAETVFTDPPYTAEGATLFLSRAVEATAAPGRDVFLAFGAKRPGELLRVQRTIAALGLTVRELRRNFNEYLGAGVLGGVSHLYHLATTSELRPVVEGTYDGLMYTREVR
jgi:predicted methyltransferase